MNNKKRTTFLVDPTVQWAIGRRVILHWMLFAVCLIAVNVMLRTILTMTDMPFGEAIRTAAMHQVSVIIVMAVMLPMFVLDTMKLSNRFAGPMYRLRNALVKIPTGEPMKALTFRTGDFWSEVAEDFNCVANHHELLRRRNAELELEVKTLRDERRLQSV
jgi:hypothetical protein